MPRNRRKAPLTTKPRKIANTALHTKMLESLWSFSVDDLEELFREPWRDGRNAVRLCGEAGALEGHHSEDGDRALLWIGETLKRDRSTLTTADYDQAELLVYELSRSKRLNDAFHGAAVGILGNWIAQSDGGGHVPNDWLRRTFWGRLRDGFNADIAVELIGKWRALDLGLKWAGTTEQETMFRWLWLNGRYQMAIALAKRHGQRP